MLITQNWDRGCDWGTGHLPRQGYHWVFPDDAPARGGGAGRRLEPPRVLFS